MLDEYRGLFAVGDTIVKFTESETAILLLLCLKYQRISLDKKNKLEDLVTAEEMQRAIKQVTGDNASASYTEATRSRVNLRLNKLGYSIKKQPRMGYYLKKGR